MKNRALVTLSAIVLLAIIIGAACPRADAVALSSGKCRAPFFAPSVPRLNFTYVDYSPRTVTEGDTVKITAYLENNGTIPLSGLVVTFSIDDKVILKKENVSVPAGANISFTVNWTADKAGYRMLKAVAVLKSIPDLPIAVGYESLGVKTKPDAPWAPLGLVGIVLLSVFAIASVPSLLSSIKKKE